VLCNFGCHPVSLHSYRSLISPDYPGYARAIIRSVLGSQAVQLFTLGTAGDINPAGYVAGQTTPRRSRQIGSILGCEVARVALGLQTRPESSLQVARKVIELPIEPLPTSDELRAMERKWAAEADRRQAEGRARADISYALIHRDWAHEALDACAAWPLPRTRPCEMQALRLGDAVLLALPQEVFTETGLAIKAASPAAWTIVCSNSNGFNGYLPIRDAYESGDYTNPQGLAPKVYGLYAYSPEAEPLLREEAIAFLRAMYQAA
jgi:neutral ceramidase